MQAQQLLNVASEYLSSFLRVSLHYEMISDWTEG